MQVHTLIGSERKTTVNLNGVLMDIYTPKVAMKMLGITKTTMIKWARLGLIKKVKMRGEPRRYFVSKEEVERVRKLLKKNWKRGKSLLPRL